MTLSHHSISPAQSWLNGRTRGIRLPLLIACSYRSTYLGRHTLVGQSCNDQLEKRWLSGRYMVTSTNTNLINGMRLAISEPQRRSDSRQRARQDSHVISVNHGCRWRHRPPSAALLPTRLYPQGSGDVQLAYHRHGCQFFRDSIPLSSRTHRSTYIHEPTATCNYSFIIKKLSTALAFLSHVCTMLR